MSESYKADIAELQELASALTSGALSKDKMLREFSLSKLFEQQMRLIERVEDLADGLERVSKERDAALAEHQAEQRRLQTSIFSQHYLNFDATLSNPELPWST